MNHEKKIVRIGGGTGGYHLLRGLKTLANTSVKAVVSMADSGGSSGELRDKWDVLPPGDILQALIALCGLPVEEKLLVRKFLRYRFTGNGLSGHAVGNFLLAGMQMYTESFISAVRAMEQLLRVPQGSILPVTVGSTHACAELADGTVVRGETHIDIPKAGRPLLPIARLWLDPPVEATEEALAAIAEADMVVIGPGDLFSSIGPCLVVNGIPEALQRTRARLVYVMNIMTKRGETGGFEGGHPDYKASDFLRAVEAWVGRSMDHILCNTEEPSASVLEAYAEEGARPVEVDLFAGGLNDRQQVLHARLLAEDGRLARHDHETTARQIGLLASVLQRRTFEREAPPV